MNISLEKNEQKTLVKLAGDLNIYSVIELKNALLDVITTTPDTELDLAEVQEFDSAALQVLALAKRAAAKNRNTMRITAHSTSVVNLFELYDLVGFFGDPILISTHTATGRPS